MARIWNKFIPLDKKLSNGTSKQTNTPLKTKVFVAMSGGVDSSVAAALLQKKGYEVVGVFIKVWQPDFAACDWQAERRDARRVAAKLEIPLLTFDLEKEYKQSVVDYLIREYRAGRTPNPDVMCNKEIKFGAFYNLARARGADYIATGHYVRLTSNLQLQMARDLSKDQSYFLWTLVPEVLERCFFPIGDYLKSEVRTLAKKFDLPTAEKKDSQGLCFVGKIDFKSFLAEFLPVKIGQVLNERGEAIGKHDGAHFYTIGERHGFTITKKTPTDKPYYVIGKDMEKNILFVSSQANVGRRTSNIIISHWFSGQPPAAEKNLLAQLRYHGPLIPCQVIANELDPSFAEVKFLENPILPTPGQSCVIYDKQTLLGGGVIL